MTDAFAPHFPLDELRCRCGCRTSPEVQANLRKLSWALERGFRGPIGEPVIVTSAHRCKDHNRAVNGSPDSRHLDGIAADVRIFGWTGEMLFGFAEAMIASGVLCQGGLGIYQAHPSILHYDMRGQKRRWRQ